MKFGTVMHIGLLDLTEIWGFPHQIFYGWGEKFLKVAYVLYQIVSLPVTLGDPTDP